MDHNKTESGVDILGKIIREYTCKHSTRRWSLRYFFNIIDIACYIAFVLWSIKDPHWQKNTSPNHRRKLFLEKLVKKGKKTSTSSKKLVAMHVTAMTISIRRNSIVAKKLT